ncbi:hypothetical protein RQP46_003618 [Phenoliferia psychrophenolica]
MNATNPFPALQAELQRRVYLNPTPSFFTHLVALNCIFAVASICTVAALVLRLRRGKLWLFAVRSTPNGSWIMPNALLLWLIYSLIFQLFAQAFIYYAREYGTVGGNIKYSAFWRCFAWIPLWIGGLTMTYSTAIAPFLHSSDPTARRVPYATISSTIFVGANIVFLGLVIPFTVIANFKFDSSINVAETLGKMLASGSAAFDAGRFDAVSEMTTSTRELTGILEDHFSEFVYWWRATFAVYAGMTGALVVIYSLSAWRHYMYLKTAIAGVRGERGSATTVYAVYVAIKPRDVAAGTYVTEVFLLLTMYIYAIFGTLSSIIILARFVFVKSDGVQGPRNATCSIRRNESGAITTAAPRSDDVPSQRLSEMNATNPFPPLQARLQRQVYLDHTRPYFANLTVLNCIFAFAAVCTLAALVLRLRRGKLWLYAIRSTANGSWIMPNSLLLWLMYSLIFQLFAQVFIYYAREYGIVGGNIRFSAFWRCFAWIPLWIGGLTMTYSTAIAPFLHSSDSTTYRVPYATISSTIFVGVHIVFLGLVVPITVLTSRRFISSINVAKDLADLLASASAAFDAGRFDAVREMTSSIEELTGCLEMAFSQFVFWWRTTFAVYAGMTGALVVIYIVSAWRHFRYLQKAIAGVREDQGPTFTVYAGQLNGLIWGYRSLLFTTFFTLALATSYLAVVLYVAIKPRDVAAGTYIYAFFGTLSSIIILARFVLVPSDGAPPPSSRRLQSEGVTVTQETVTLYEYAVAFDMIMIRKPVAAAAEQRRSEMGLGRSGREPEEKAF